MLGIRRPLKPCENGRNIVGQQLPTLLDVTCCVHLYTLLRVVGSCGAKFETSQTFSYVQTDTTTPNELLCPFAGSFKALFMVCTLTLCVFI